MTSAPPTPAVGDGTAAAAAEDPAFLTTQLVTCLGNKRALLPFVEAAVEHVRARLGGRRLRAADLFAGSGVVARLLKRHCALLLANDLEAYARVAAACHLRNASTIDWPEVRAALAHVQAACASDPRPGFVCELYAPRDDAAVQRGERCFYTRRNALYLDTARRAIGELPPALQPLLLGPLLARASMHANTAGVFKGFYKNAAGVGEFGGRGRDALARILHPIACELPVLSRCECDVAVHQADANELVAQLPELDLVYLDPPYNEHPYGSNYFMLNLLVDYERPHTISPVSGIPTTWRRSRYNRRREAGPALLAVIDRAPARFVLVSASCEGFVPREELLAELQARGRVTETAIPYRAFRGSRNLRARPLRVTESLYLLER